MRLILAIESDRPPQSFVEIHRWLPAECSHDLCRIGGVVADLDRGPIFRPRYLLERPGTRGGDDLANQVLVFPIEDLSIPVEMREHHRATRPQNAVHLVQKSGLVGDALERVD